MRFGAIQALFLCSAGFASSLASAQSSGAVGDAKLLSLTTPSLLSKGETSLGLAFRGFGGSDKLLYTDVSAGYGLSQGLNLEFLGDFASDGSYTSGNGSIRYGGSDGEVRLRYKLPFSIPASVQTGLAYSATPAQEHRVAATVGASFGYSLGNHISIYAEPKAVILDTNSLVGLGLGATVGVTHGVELIGEWTPMLSGRNSIGTQTLGRDQVELYGVGLRFTNLVRGWTLDVGYTNSTGSTTGFSLTPALGNTGGLLIGGSYRF